MHNCDDAVRRIEALLTREEQLFDDRNRIAIQCAGNVFVSHTSLDHEFIEERIVPVLQSVVGPCFFMLNERMWRSVRRDRDGRFPHAGMMRAALEACKTVLVVASENSLRSDWAQWECHTAIKQNHPIIVCAVDKVGLRMLPPGFADGAHSDRTERIVDFQRPQQSAQDELLRLMRAPEFAIGPWNGRPCGTPISFSGEAFLQMYREYPSGAEFLPQGRLHEAIERIFGQRREVPN
jgi:hypothetical protein